MSAALDGYESIVLWPEPPKKEIIAPVPLAPVPRDLAPEQAARYSLQRRLLVFPAAEPRAPARMRTSPTAARWRSTSTPPPISLSPWRRIRTLARPCGSTVAAPSKSRSRIAITASGAFALAMILADTSRTRQALALSWTAAHRLEPAGSLPREAGARTRDPALRSSRARAAQAIRRNHPRGHVRPHAHRHGRPHRHRAV